MCSSCYRKYGRNQNAWNCQHKERLLYSMGMCQTCYLSDYHKVTFNLLQGLNYFIRENVRTLKMEIVKKFIYNLTLIFEALFSSMNHHKPILKLMLKLNNTTTFILKGHRGRTTLCSHVLWFFGLL